MESDLLDRENEFYRENQKLERKTKELMRKVNDVMKIQDNLLKMSLKRNTEIANVKINNFKNDHGNHPERAGDCSEDDESIGIPSCVPRIGARVAGHIYRVKIKSLQADNVILQNENKKGNEEIKKLQKENQHLYDEKEKWFFQYNCAKNAIEKLESQVSSLNLKIQIRDNETASIKKELEQIKKELKNANSNAANFEVRLNRAYEENETLKASLKIALNEEKELKGSYRKQISDLTATVRHIEKHKTELLNGFQKQLQLIDVLKKQKIYLKERSIAEMSEAQYMKLLDVKLD